MRDPYAILGIPECATLEEIKKAYRREAMQWHPDRNGNSSDAKEKFHRAAEAYRQLSENYVSNRSSQPGRQSPEDHRYQSAHSGQSDNGSSQQYSSEHSEGSSADTVFWEAMLDFAIKLAQTGLTEKQISSQLVQNGCQQALASIIAGKAFNIHAHYSAHAGRKRKHGTEKSSFKEERLEAELQRAFIGGRNFFLSPRDTIEYYLVVFRELRQGANLNPFSKINSNKRLLRILNFSILLFAVIIVAIDLNPGESRYQLLTDVNLLQIPLAILSLMFIWTLYRRLWLITCTFWLAHLTSLAIFNVYAPQALDNDHLLILPIASVCFSPFIILALFGNYFYYRKAQSVIHSANLLFEDHEERIVWIRSCAGTSSTAVFIFTFIFLSSLLYLKPEHQEILDAMNRSLVSTDTEYNDTENQKIKLQLQEAGQFFEIAETHFNSSPPDFVKASMAYSKAADNGSLLAAYKLGYMHYAGLGVPQNDLMAMYYFEQATRTPLAFQPHSLQLTTEFLAESYNNLGIMHQAGYGTKRNTKTASEMYRKATEFGSQSAQKNLATVYTRGGNDERWSLATPTFK